MLPAAPTRTQYLRHFDASNVQLMGPDPNLDFAQHEISKAIDRSRKQINRNRRGGLIIDSTIKSENDEEILKGFVREWLDRHGQNRKSLAFVRSEEQTSELQSLMRISYAFFCFNTKKT